MFPGTLRVKVGATLKFFKPRPVPYALELKIEDELKRLEKPGAIQKLGYIGADLEGGHGDPDPLSVALPEKIRRKPKKQ